ncbi:hypothetical protein [Actinoallomurus sp. NPDC052274]|uniref:hypothetical protein n=1 Tax=Actinoallomurus sp. NPDC052274 TaxID=3155420 RepID=UPI00341AAA41
MRMPSPSRVNRTVTASAVTLAAGTGNTTAAAAAVLVGVVGGKLTRKPSDEETSEDSGRKN